LLRRFSEIAAPAEWKKAYEDSVKLIDDIVNDRVELDGTPTVRGSIAEIVAPDKVFDFTNEDSSWYQF
jgi:hypothetical protein